MGATVLKLAAAAQAAGPPAHAAAVRPRLALVPTGPGARGRSRAEPVPLRLTRFGRLVVTVAVALAVSALAIGLVGQLASASGDSRPVIVQSGQTLSQIAARELPGLPIRDGVVALQLANGLSSVHVQTGQRLVIPGP